jgi:hypothetical protein
MKYRDNLTEAELKEFMDEVDALHQALSSMSIDEPMPDGYEDEDGLLRAAALNRGQP